MSFLAALFAKSGTKLIGAGVLLTALAAAVIWFGAHERHLGAAGVQAKWDLANAQQTQLALKSSESARATEYAQAQAFAGIESTYLQTTAHVYPSIVDSLPAAVAAGTVRLRNDCPATGASAVPSATARARAADAAATQALADRTAAAIAAVRAGQQADARERQLGAQVIALQSLLNAERHGR